MLEKIGQEIGVADCLVLAAHDPKGHYRAAVFDQHAGDDGVHGPFAWLNAIRMGGVKVKTEPPVL